MRAISFLTFSFSLSDVTELGLGLLTLKLFTMGTSASAFIECLSGVAYSLGEAVGLSQNKSQSKSKSEGYLLANAASGLKESSQRKFILVSVKLLTS